MWAALWEINSTAFHHVEILALDAHKNERGLVCAPSGCLPDHRVDPIGLRYTEKPLLGQQVALL